MHRICLPRQFFESLLHFSQLRAHSLSLKLHLLFIKSLLLLQFSQLLIGNCSWLLGLHHLKLQLGIQISNTVRSLHLLFHLVNKVCLTLHFLVSLSDLELERLQLFLHYIVLLLEFSNADILSRNGFFSINFFKGIEAIAILAQILFLDRSI